MFVGSCSKHPTWGSGKECFFSNCSWFTGHMLFNLNQRAMGAEFGECIFWLMFLCLKYHHLTVEYSRVHLCALSGIYWFSDCLLCLLLPCWTAPAILLFSVLKEAPAIAGFPCSAHRALNSWLQGCICEQSVLFSLFVFLFIPGCPVLDYSMRGSLKCAFVSSREFFV